MSETVKIGIVGIGNMGSAHAKSILAGNIQGMELAAVCDIAESKRLWAAEKPAGRPVLHRLQGDDRQRPCARRSSSRRRTTCIPRSRSTALKRACTCSPKSRPASTPKQVEEMNEGRREIRQGLRHHVQPAQRTPKFQKMREIVQSGALGELKRCVWIITNWYRTQAYYDSGTWRATWAGEGGGRTDQPVPAQPRPVAVDLRIPNKISAHCKYGRWHNIEVEDEVTAYAEYPERRDRRVHHDDRRVPRHEPPRDLRRQGQARLGGRQADALGARDAGARVLLHLPGGLRAAEDDRHRNRDGERRARAQRHPAKLHERDPARRRAARAGL